MYTSKVTENVSIGTYVGTVFAEDSDQNLNGRIWYEITAGNTRNAFQIHNSTGEILTAGTIDRETIAKYTLTIKAQDLGQPSPRKVKWEFRILKDFVFIFV